jgi:hypothetical protein
MITITEVAATCNKEDNGAVVFTLQTDGAMRAAMTGVGLVFAVGDQIILRNSVSSADATINNDGCYIVEAISDNWIEVVHLGAKRVWNAYADAAAADFDEIDVFIFHPDKRTGQLLFYVINSAANSPEISFQPGGYWAAKIETDLPVMQGQPLLATTNFFQIETAPYLQTEEDDLGDDDIEQKGTILMRVIPTTAVSGTTISVALIQLA